MKLGKLLHKAERENKSKRNNTTSDMDISRKKKIVMLFTAGVFVLLIGFVLPVMYTHQTSISYMVDGIVREKSELELTQMMRSFSENMLSLDRFSMQLNLDGDVRSLMTKKQVDFREPAVVRIQNTLHGMMDQNLWLHSAYIYYHRQGVVVTDEAVVPVGQMTAAQRNLLRLTRFGDYRITGSHVIEGVSMPDQTNVVSVLRFFPVYSTENWGVTVVNVRVVALSSQMTNLAREEGGFVFLVNGNGTIELCSDSKYLKGNLLTLLKDQDLASGAVKFAGEEYRVYTNEPNYFGWQLVWLYPASAVSARYAAIERNLTISTLGIALAGVMVLRGGVRFVRQLSHQQKIQDHLQLISEGHRPRFVESLFYGLLHGRLTIDQQCRDQIRHYEVPTQNYAAVLLVLENSGQDECTVDVNGILKRYAVGTCLPWKKNAYIALVHIPEKKMEMAQSYLTSTMEYLIVYLQNNLSVNLLAYIGSIAETLEGLQESLVHAEMAMDARWLMENEHGVYCYVPQANPEKLMYSEMQAQNVYALIKGGQGDEAVTNMQRMINTLCKENQFAPKAVRAGVNRFVTNLIQNLDTGGNIKEAELLREYYALKCLADIRVWLAELIQNTCKMVQALYSGTGNNASVEQIEQYIKAHLEKEITLSSIAEHFSVSESYFSRMFKQKFGVNFLEYVNRQRIENAKRLLDFEQRTVNEVATMVGFTNVQTFIRVFKNFEGMTPGVYQSMRRTIMRP